MKDFPHQILNLCVTKNGLPAVKFTYRHMLLKEATAVRAPKKSSALFSILSDKLLLAAK
jgi:hypothetical protein